jgi:hypothetical protein
LIRLADDRFFKGIEELVCSGLTRSLAKLLLGRKDNGLRGAG